MKLRKVMFKKWITAEFIKEGIRHNVKNGTSCWESEFSNAGLFHQWGSAYEEQEGGGCTYTVAIVEMADGTIQQVLPSSLKFLDLPHY